MALNDGYAVDEAKFNGAVFTYGLVTFALAFVIFLTVNAALEESGGSVVILGLPLVVHYLVASLRAQRWPALNDPNYTYHRFVISTLRRQNTGWLRWKLAISTILAIGLVLVVGWSAIKLQSEWAVVEADKNIDRLVSALGMLIFAPFCAIHAFRIQIALRRQRNGARWVCAKRHRMFDNVERTEAGKLRDGFLTDEQGRRIHCPRRRR